MKNFDRDRLESTPYHSKSPKATPLYMKSNNRLSARNSLYRDLLSSLVSLPIQAFFAYLYYFILTLILSVVDFLKPFLMLGVFLGLILVSWFAANRLASTTSLKVRENTEALLVEVEMDMIKDVPEMLRQLKGLTREDIIWMSEVGSKKKILPNEILIHEQQPIDALYIILSGTFEVSTTSRSKFSPPKLSSGKVQLSIVDSHIIGEMSFIREDSYLPSANVKAIKESWVWSIPSSVLRDKIAVESDFGTRFYKFLGSILADRLDSSNKLRSASKSAESEKQKKFRLFLHRQKPSYSSPLTNLTPGMLLFMIDTNSG
ncbi:MAG: cyclic nucleotide-binding domain-containing protein [Pseudanabaenales cyanobacterium]|nr:cyclic nucleotide-binding domain-containing protein [Pseudanabaenales cyanobacterium]